MRAARAWRQRIMMTSFVQYAYCPIDVQLIVGHNCVPLDGKKISVCIGPYIYSTIWFGGKYVDTSGHSFSLVYHFELNSPQSYHIVHNSGVRSLPFYWSWNEDGARNFNSKNLLTDYATIHVIHFILVWQYNFNTPKCQNDSYEISIMPIRQRI